VEVVEVDHVSSFLGNLSTLGTLAPSNSFPT
jgi:hypothetical protein